MHRPWLYLAAVREVVGESSDALHGTGRQGNRLCWDYPNLEDKVLTFADCCSSLDAARECFRGVNGWFNYDFCCLEPAPEHENCDWNFLLSRVGEDVQPLENYPVILREVCCIYPHPGCWGDAEDDVLAPMFTECCFPGLRRRLLYPQEDDVTWLEGDLDEEFEALEGLRWSEADFDAFEEELQQYRDAKPGELGLLPCRVRVRNGKLIPCNYSQCQTTMDPNNDCAYVRAVEVALRIIGTHLPLPDLDMFVSPTNNDAGISSVPVFTRSRPRSPRGKYIALPFEYQLHPWQSRKATATLAKVASKHPWERRLEKLLWRGTNSNHVVNHCSLREVAEGSAPWSLCVEGWGEALLGIGDDALEWYTSSWNFTNWYQTPRGVLVLLSQYIAAVDAKWTGISRNMEPGLWEYFEAENMTAPSVKFWEQLAYKYGINIEGTGIGDRIYWQMLGGQVVLNHETPQVSWLLAEPSAPTRRGALKPYQHFVPLRFDLADLVDRLEWMKRNDELARSIAESSQMFAERHLGYDSILFYLDRVIRRYASDHLK
ncbi:KDEL motif-containing protein 1 [Symbiodinium microadriaticum]|uniref:KDEL motif-containing protein 1 n=1 Tax=Symbiodinium microadriaticum TaxID=2951 RepID=A0A1Q9F018_SYMMI|nr:KDEL motif-containing protein 1 [Symbiodinium microadriaticum]